MSINKNEIIEIAVGDGKNWTAIKEICREVFNSPQLYRRALFQPEKIKGNQGNYYTWFPQVKSPTGWRNKLLNDGKTIESYKEGENHNSFRYKTEKHITFLTEGKPL